MPAKTIASTTAVVTEPARVNAADVLGAEFFTSIPKAPQIARVTASRASGPRQAPWKSRDLSPAQAAGLERAQWTGDVEGFQSQTFMPSESARGCRLEPGFSLTTKQKRGTFYSAIVAAMMRRGPLAVADAVALAAAVPVTFSSAAVLGAKLASACAAPVELSGGSYRVIGESQNRQLDSDAIDAVQRETRLSQEEKTDAVQTMTENAAKAENMLIGAAAKLLESLTR